MKRYELDLTSLQEITISGGNNNDVQLMTNIGANFYIGVTSSDNLEKYTLSGTTLTQDSTITITGASANWDLQASLSTDGISFFYMRGTFDPINWDGIDQHAISKVAIAGGAAVQAIEAAHLGFYLVGLLPDTVDTTKMIGIELSGDVPFNTTPANEPLLWRKLILTKYTKTALGL